MTERIHVPIGSDADLEAFANSVFVSSGTAAPGATYTTPIYYHTAGTATYAWGGTSYVKFKATS